MKLQQRKELLARLSSYLAGSDEQWQLVKQRAFLNNNWFIPEFIELSVNSIAKQFLQPGQLQQLIDQYTIPEENLSPKKVGIVMAGNIPLVGFHDLLCVFITGHYALVKPSSKDEVLINHIIKKLIQWEPSVGEQIMISERIPNCDAYIATGSNNSSRYFE